MKYISVFFGLMIIGVGLLAYSFNYMELFDWQEVEDKLELTEQSRQEMLQSDLELIYESGFIIDLINLETLIVFTLGLFLTIFGLISGAHSSIDKLFFKKFYQEPNLRVALRRGILWAIYVVINFILLLYNFDTWNLLLMILVVFIVIEFVATGLMSRGQSALEE